MPGQWAGRGSDRGCTQLGHHHAHPGQGRRGRSLPAPVQGPAQLDQTEQSGQVGNLRIDRPVKMTSHSRQNGGKARQIVQVRVTSDT